MGVGYGILSTVPTLIIQVVGKLFKITMLCTETLKATAMPPQVSPERTVYSNGGKGVSVGIAVGASVAVPVGVIVAVSVGVPTAVG